MARTLLLLCTILLPACSAIVYTVGDSSGWDISTDLASWAAGKTFATGDALLFQYSQYYSVFEVTEEEYNGCGMANVVRSYTNGNTSVSLRRPGERYFVCGNRLYCLGGMKLKLSTVGSQGSSPVVAEPPPQTGGGGTGMVSSWINSSSHGGVSLLLLVVSICLFFMGTT